MDGENRGKRLFCVDLLRGIDIFYLLVIGYCLLATGFFKVWPVRDFPGMGTSRGPQGTSRPSRRHSRSTGNIDGRYGKYKDAAIPTADLVESMVCSPEKREDYARRANLVPDQVEGALVELRKIPLDKRTDLLRLALDAGELKRDFHRAQLTAIGNETTCWRVSRQGSDLLSTGTGRTYR